MESYCATGIMVPSEAAIIIDEFCEQGDKSIDYFFGECIEVGILCAKQYLANLTEGYPTALVWYSADRQYNQEFLDFEQHTEQSAPETAHMFDVVDPFATDEPHFYLLNHFMPQIQPLIEALDIPLHTFMQRAIELRIGLQQVREDGGNLAVSNGAEEFWYFADASS